MSKLAEFKRLEAQLAAQLQQLDTLKNDAELKKEIQFEGKLRALLTSLTLPLAPLLLLWYNAVSAKLRSTRIPTQMKSSRQRAVITKY